MKRACDEAGANDKVEEDGVEAASDEAKANDKVEGRKISYGQCPGSVNKQAKTGVVGPRRLRSPGGTRLAPLTGPG